MQVGIKITWNHQVRLLLLYHMVGSGGARNGQVQAKAAEKVPVQANPAERGSLEYDIDYEEDMIEDSDDDIYSDACQNGPGAIDWYKGLQPLMAHAKTKGSKRVKLHREFAELLDEELSRKGTSIVPVSEIYGKWHGLHQSVFDKEIVWPPMQVMNTQLDQDENEKWLGMGNQELLDYFSAYNAVKARHSYGPKGHWGTSFLVFEALHKLFTCMGNIKFTCKIVTFLTEIMSFLSRRMLRGIPTTTVGINYTVNAHLCLL
ncbi:hypothetical protein MKX03_028950 [Papaver bracteatum]|nr:hypothetical protein MKX03_028950 [Papaver bracteatum]